MQSEELRVIGSSDELIALDADWDALLRRCPDHYLSQSFAWAEAAWRLVAVPRRRSLCCVTLRDGGTLVGLWPLVSYEESGKRIVRPLGSEASEYCAPLVAPDDHAVRRTRLLWRTAAREGDLALLPYVREGTPLAGLLPRAGLWRVTDFPAPAPYAARADYADWPAYQKTLSGSLRHKVRRVRRRLGEKGRFALGIEPVEGRAALIDWMLAHKKRWLDREGMQSDFIGWRDYRDFLVAMVGQSQGDAGLLLFSLKLDGVPIAGQLAAVDARRFEAMIGVYDPDWSNFSPGQILTEHCLAWSFERGLDFDLRIGTEPYKRDWAPRVCNTLTWYVATSPRGLPFVIERQRVIGWGKLKTRLARWKNSWRSRT